MTSHDERAMRKSRKARGNNNVTADAWWYIDDHGIDVIGRAEDASGYITTTNVRLTRRQILRAAELWAERSKREGKNG